MLEQSKAARRRFYNGNFHNKYFKGHGIDIGGKPDPFAQYIGVFPLVKDVKIWDIEDGDAQIMESCSNELYDFVVSSHCLEHMHDVYEAFKNWLRITKAGGYLIITVPDEDMYEQQVWPSRYNHDHKWTFTIQKKESWSHKSINVFELLQFFQEYIEIEKVEKITDFYNYNLHDIDQTLQPNVESAIEFIVRKKAKKEYIDIQKDRVHLKHEHVRPFPIEVSHLLSKIEELLQHDTLYCVYGYGSVGKMLDRYLGEKIGFFVDKSSSIQEISLTRDKVYSPHVLKDIEYDYVIISVLGREEEICNDLVANFGVLREKIILLR